MADRQREGVGRVVGFCRGGQAQYPLHHIDYLALFRSAVTHHGLLDLQRRILKNWDFVAVGRQEDDTAAVGYGDAGGDIRVEKKLFHADRLRLESVKQFL